MSHRLNDLWSSAAHDGASCPVGVEGPQERGARGEDDLLEAWFRERAVRIECSLVLEEARRVLGRLVGEAGVSPRRRRQAARVVHAIRLLQKDHGARPEGA